MRQEQRDLREPAPAGRAVTEARRAFRNIWTLMAHCRVYRGRLLLLALLAPLASIPPLMTPWLLRIVIDKAYPSRDYRMLAYLCAGFAAMGVASNLLSVASAYLAMYVRHRLQYRLSFRILRAIQRLPQSCRDDCGSGSFLVRAEKDVDAVSQSLTQLLPQIARMACTFIAAMILMMRLNAGITAIVLVVVPINYFIIARMAGKMRRFQEAARTTTDEFATFVGEAVEGAVIARLFLLNRTRRQKLRMLLRERVQIAFSAWRTGTFWGQCANAVSGGWGLILVCAGWYLVFTDRLKLGQTVALGMYVGMLSTPFEQLGSLYQTLIRESVAAARVLDLLQSRHEAVPAKAQKTLATSPRRYVLRGLSFGYQKERLCLSDVNLDLHLGQTIAVIGPTGGGKSTLIRILCGLDDRYSGQFLVDGHELREINRDNYLRHVSLVPQNSFFFSDSIRDNLGPRRGTISTDRVRRCAAALGLDGVIDATPAGYNTKLGNKGIRLSAGQYQKLAALRAILKDASLLLLDEATASMDIESERKLLQGIMAQKPRACLTLFVTHHIAITTEPWIDEILVLVDGRIAEQGSHVDLLKKQGLYHRWLSLSRDAFSGSSRLIDELSRGEPLEMNASRSC